MAFIWLTLKTFCKFFIGAIIWAQFIDGVVKGGGSMALAVAWIVYCFVDLLLEIRKLVIEPMLVIKPKKEREENKIFFMSEDYN